MYGFPSPITPSRLHISKIVGYFWRAQVLYLMQNKSEHPNFENYVRASPQISKRLGILKGNFVKIWVYKGHNSNSM